MLIQDRRRCRTPAVNELRDMLNATQLHNLSRLEKEGWRLRFVRSQKTPMPVPVLSTRDNAHAVMGPDGRLDETHAVPIRS